MKRLGTDYIDSLHVHDPSIDEITPEVLNFQQRLKDWGVVRATGINTGYVTEDIKAVDIVMPEVVRKRIRNQVGKSNKRLEQEIVYTDEELEENSRSTGSIRFSNSWI